jgi:hypothetical protein
MKVLAAIWLGACAVFGLAVLVFALQVTFRDGPVGAEWSALGMALGVVVLPLAIAWGLFRRGWWLAAMALGVAPVVLVVYAISQIRIRMF